MVIQAIPPGGRGDMDRVSLGEGRWFNPETAVAIQEGTRWDGNNYISLATGSQWDHETLYFTRKGAWVLRTWSQRDAVRDQYTILTEEQAANWISDNELTDVHLAALNEVVRSRIKCVLRNREV